MDIRKLRTVICRHRGGLDNATDAEIRELARHLPPAVLAQYEAELKGDRNAVSNKPKREN